MRILLGLTTRICRNSETLNYYVAQLALQSRRKDLAFLFGWNPWSMVRVVAFLWLGIACGLPLLAILFPIPASFSLTCLIPGVIGIILDVVMKLFLSRRWSSMLKRNLLM